MSDCHRRSFIAFAAGAGASFIVSAPRAADACHTPFVAEALRMRNDAVARGDQAYGAVVVRDGIIIGYGPSRVVTDRNPDAHAERVALWNAQKRLGTQQIAGAVIYSTSRPCSICERALADAGVTRMYYGAEATDGGHPQPR